MMQGLREAKPSSSEYFTYLVNNNVTINIRYFLKKTFNILFKMNVILPWYCLTEFLYRDLVAI